MNLNDCTPSHTQSIRMKKQAQQNTLSSDGIYEIMSEEKGNQTVVRQIICTYILHIKCACISDGMDKHSKFLHLFAQLI
jgi:hypothetical protein